MAQETQSAIVTKLGLLVAGMHRLIELEFHVKPKVTGDRALILLELHKLGGSVTNKYFVAAGVYAGANIAYNLDKLHQDGYIIRSTSQIDARETELRITEKGTRLAKRVQEFLEPLEQLLIDAGFTHDALIKLARDIEDRYRPVRIL